MRLRHLLTLLILMIGCQTISTYAQVTSTWTDSTGNWSNAANWSTNPAVPNNDATTSYSVKIDVAGSAVSMDLANVSIDTLNVGATDLLTINSGNTLKIGTYTPSANSFNYGTINISDNATLGTNEGSSTFNNYGTINVSTVNAGIVNAGQVFNNYGNINNLNLNGFPNSSGGWFTNYGTITNACLLCDSPTGFLDFTNAAGGTMTGVSSGLLFVGSFTNAGTFTGNLAIDETSFDNSGTFTGNLSLFGGIITNESTGTFTGSISGPNSDNATIENYGKLTVPLGASISGPDGQLVLFNEPGATLSNAGTITNASFYVSGTIINRGTLNNSGTINNMVFNNPDNLGMATFINLGTLENSGVINNSGSFTTSGSVTITNTGVFNTSTNYTQTAGTTIVNGTLNATGNAIVDIQGGSGLGGVGTVNGNVATRGIMTPGDLGAPGIFTISGNYQQLDHGTLVDLMSPLSQSLLNVSGNVILGPNSLLQIILLDGFNPLGKTFDVLNYGTLFGQFANGTTFSADGYLWNLTYSDHEIEVTAIGTVGTPEPGSFPLLAIGIAGLILFLGRKHFRSRPLAISR